MDKEEDDYLKFPTQLYMEMQDDITICSVLFEQLALLALC